ncbi:Pentatricopeptide repeat-containing protein 2 [Habropoda laboriosa]|uniref:Pentatricopeptide repeat-containing protein 2 n=1 Tax=Habropoda laboriosa TaxID=597456 RepID=A0A0L7R8S5_9HYME|nr:PREDICTED: uncharacterized protein LOC108570639 [Habropoda laboriosa]KOC67270.1 Pentatricopeptide repeat-containing protein 2 [Habropoda laboriosa]
MAINVRGLRRLNISFATNVLFQSNFINVGVRSLYTDRDMGVTNYENTRFMFRNQYMSIEETFRSKMKEICKQEDGIIFTEDLKAMLHLAQESQEDMELLSSMLEKYVHHKETYKYNAYVFGPVVMRMLYYLNKPLVALAMFENTQLRHTFEYRSSCRILLCLLLKHNMFKELRCIYDEILNQKGQDFIGRNSVLVYAACLKENTPESFEYGLAHWQNEIASSKPSARCTTLTACLAIKQNSPDTALEMVSLLDKDRTLAVRSLKILAYMHMEKYLQIIPLLKYVIEQNENFRNVVFGDVIYQLEEKIKEQNFPEKQDLEHLINRLKATEKLDTQCTLEEYLFKPMMIQHRDKLQQKDWRVRTNWRHTHNKTGLKDYL